MPVYEYVCTTCDEHFSRLRPMAEADQPTECSAGHRARRTLSVFARSAVSVGASGGGSSLPAMPSGGGCCGGGCGCG